MTDEMPPGRGFGAGGPGDALPALIQSWRQQEEASHRAAEIANIMMMKNRMVPPSYYRDLLSLASALIAEGRYELRHELAVIVAQMACELVVEQTLTPLIKKPKPRQSFNVHAEEVLKLYKSLTRDPIDTASFWTTHDTHANRRHKVVHVGARVSQAEAQESLTVATQFVDHVEKVRGESLR